MEGLSGNAFFETLQNANQLRAIEIIGLLRKIMMSIVKELM